MFCLCGLSEGQGLHGHHTTPSLIVSRTTSPRHPAVQLAASTGAPTGQTQQGPWAAGRLPRGQIAPILRQAFVYVSAYVCVLKNVHICVQVGVCVCVFLFSWMGRRSFPPDAFAPRSLSGVPVKSRWASTVGTYISLQGKAIGPNDKTHQSSSQPGLTCPSVLFMVAYPWRKNAYGRGALSSPVGTCVRSQQWRAFKTVQRCWCSLLAWQEVVILFPCAWFPSHVCNCIMK